MVPKRLTRPVQVNPEVAHCLLFKTSSLAAGRSPRVRRRATFPGADVKRSKHMGQHKKNLIPVESWQIIQINCKNNTTDTWLSLSPQLHVAKVLPSDFVDAALLHCFHWGHSAQPAASNHKKKAKHLQVANNHIGVRIGVHIGFWNLYSFFP